MAKQIKYTARLRPFLVEGLDEVIKNLNIELKKIHVGSSRGLVQVSHHIRRATENSTPLTPVDKGNLRASYFTAAAEGLVDDPLGFSGNFKKPRKHHITEGEIRGQFNAITAASLTRVRSIKDPNIIFGYGVNYAAWVHEMVGVLPENWSREGSDAKWLEAHLNRSYDTILRIVQDNAKIK